jgi:ribonucleoside-diphosphate reductase alpha chain
MPNQFCNLSSIVVHEDDTEETLMDKAEVATILGTWQSTLTNFGYLRPEWKQNTEQERLLGVSMTGIFGNALLNGKHDGLDRTGALLRRLRQHAVDVNAREAAAVGVEPSAAITCVKPEGTTSQKTHTSSGLHAWHEEQYERTTRQDMKDPVTTFMIDAGFPWEPDVTNPEHTAVFSWPIEAPKDAITRKDISAIDHLEMWMLYQRDWCEHKPSVTITVKSHEWDDVREWVWKNFDDISGVSFLPYSDHTYRQAPYQDLTRAEYEDLVERMPKNVDWSLLSVYETEDMTTSTQDLACVAGGCEVPDSDLEEVKELEFAGQQ